MNDNQPPPSDNIHEQEHSIFDNAADNPFAIFAEWFEKAKNHSDIKDATALCLATATKDGKPANRMVLLKDYSEQGFVFYTNLESRKGQHIASNPHAAMCFYWDELDFQIRIEGQLRQVSDDVADEYFNSRPFTSRVGVWVSKQSQKLDSRVQMIKELAVKTAYFAVNELSRPPYWSGFCLEPEYFEFWRGDNFRIHDRVCYTKNADTASGWSKNLLYP